MNTDCTHSTNYISDVSDDEWAMIASYVDKDPKIGSPRSVCMRCVVNTLFYIHRTGCQWNMLPADLQNYGTVYHHFRNWVHDGTLARINHDLIHHVRRLMGRNPEPTLAIVDSQSVKTTEVGGDVGFDAHTSIKGRKRHIFVDVLGLVLSVTVTAASVQDAASAPLIGPKLRHQFPSIIKVLADQGYKRAFCEWFIEYLGWIVDVVVRPPVDPMNPGFHVLPKRWIVERTFAWMGRYRRLSKDYEYHTTHSEGMILLESIRRMLKISTTEKNHM